MKIIILGAGQVGTSMAEILSREDNDITLVDIDSEKLAGLQDRLDIRTVHGAGSHPSVLEQAGGPDADLVLAVTNQDEVNMASCQIAHSLFHTPKKIARIRSGEYLSHPEIFVDDAIPIDVIISPEHIVTQHIRNLIQYPNALQVVSFAKDRIQLVGVRANQGSPLIGRQLKALREDLPDITATMRLALARLAASMSINNSSRLSEGGNVDWTMMTSLPRTVSSMLTVNSPSENFWVRTGTKVVP